MKNILLIIKNDLKSILKHKSAMIVVIALSIIPSLYAWFNIWASWDPYSKNATSQIKVAVVNEDTGTSINGKQLNIGNQVIEELKKNDAMGWQFESKNDAYEHVREGKYYALIRIPEDFSKDITSIVNGDVKKGELIYVVNQKVNAIAPKITDKGASTLQTTINEEVVKTVGEVVFKISNEAGIKLEESMPQITNIYDKLVNLQSKFKDINKIVDEADVGTKQLISLVEDIQNEMPLIEKALNDTKSLGNDVSKFLSNAKTTVNNVSPIIKRDIELVSYISGETYKYTDEIRKAVEQGSDKVPQMVDNLKNKAEGLKKINDSLIQILEKANSFEKDHPLNEQVSKLKEYSSQIENLINDVNAVKNNLDKGEDQVLKLLNKVSEDSKKLSEKSEGIIKYFNEIIMPKLIEILGKQDADKISGAVQNQMQVISAVNNSLNSYIEGAVDLINSSSTRKDEIIKNLNEKISYIKNINSGIISILEKFDDKDIDKSLKDYKSKLQEINAKIDKMTAVLENIKEQVNQGKEPALELIDKVKTLSKDINTISNSLESKFNTEILDKINNILDKGYVVSNEAVKILQDVQGKLPEVISILDKAHKGSKLGNEKVTEIKNVLPEAEKKYSDILDNINKIKKNVDINEIINILKSNVEKRSEFLSSAVDVKNENMFPIANYGTAMTPFYTILCLWVGMLLLVSVLKTDSNTVPGAKAYEAYFGKMALFVGIAIVQSIIVSLGDLFILKITALHPVMFVFVNIFSSIIFGVIVYSCVSIGGNVGKVIGILLLVLQVAGSGGTFPIQLMPNFFQILNKFLPFTYAISLSRESIGGIVISVVLRDILILSSYALLFILLSLVLKKFANNFMKKYTADFEESGL